MKRRFVAGLMLVTAGILTVPAAGTAAADTKDGDMVIGCLLIYPAPEGCESPGNNSSVGSIDFATLMGSISSPIS
ncbi:hypothetical protein M2284_002857 [Rhodococcus sp. LBL1]|nr:hypothetical protein [Rhodococcus sp. LBL1]MDH6684478.1 hypothetical protein [Rhodococcus sp. LBL2]